MWVLGVRTLERTLIDAAAWVGERCWNGAAGATGWNAYDAHGAATDPVGWTESADGAGT